MNGSGANAWRGCEVRFLKGVGPRRAALLERLGIRTLGDLLLHAPRAYLDRRRIEPIAGLRPEAEVTLIARVKRVALRRTRGRVGDLVARLFDETGEIDAVWFQQPYLGNVIRPGVRLLLSGRVRSWRGLQLSSPEFELLDESGEGSTLSGGRIVPLYPLTAGLSQKVLRRWIRSILDLLPSILPDPLPETVRRRLGLPGLRAALTTFHFPETIEEAERARRRLAFDEILSIQLVLLRVRGLRDQGEGRALDPDPGVIERIRDALPFRLTGAQERAFTEIRVDLARSRPTTRLLQGDVGSGKTVVAALACGCAAAAGGQACFLAPTEILALQHAETLGRFLAPAGIRIDVLTGRTPTGEREKILARLEMGTADLLVGTHALLEPDVRFRDLGLVVVDEQHRFGVYQRLRIREKGRSAHTLVMSATPIPRSLALTFYGDLDITTIDEIPAGRTPVRTRIVDRSRWNELLRFVAKRIGEGDQAFFVYPLVDESAHCDLRDATRMHEEIAAHPAFEKIEVGLLHGRIGPEERARTVAALRRRELRALVATTVIEVGFDLPGATIMVVEHPERFGLSQLHQLRGRIGRAPGQVPYFFLMRPEEEGSGGARLDVLVRETDGFRVAEEDLRLRGPGELLGSRQTGIPRMRVADLVRDRELLLEVRGVADGIARSDPGLEGAEHRPLWEEAARRHPEGARLFTAG